jgi:cytochrome P450
MTMLAAGHDTTATALAWAFDLLLRNPAVLERLQDDIAIGDGSYLDATVKEVLRLRPVVQEVSRTLKRPLQVGRHTLPAGVSACPSILLAQRRADCYREPLEFRPERFLDDNPDPLSWLPFGGGIRRCIGVRFATMEIEAVLRTVLGAADLRPLGRRGERPRRRAVTMMPAHGTRILVERLASAAPVPSN